MRRAVLLTLAVLTLAFAPAPFPRPQRRLSPRDLAQGEWLGRESRQQLRVAGERMTYNPDTPNAIEYVWKTDTTSSPATYHAVGVAGGSASGREFRGIWRVQGDTFWMSYNYGKQPLPTAFEGQGKGQMVEVYVRAR